MENLVGKTLRGRYRVESSLGRGGMADVYMVWDKERAVYLALKLLREDLAQDRIFLRRFQREADTLARLQHPNIVRFYGLEQDGLLAFMLMDFVDGTSLRTEIFQLDGQPMEYDRVRAIFRPICSALYYAHRMGLVHCDLKPGNIMLHQNGNVLVADFGIARMTDTTTATMVGMGTPAYMAPEQVSGLDPTPQTDIYALGVVLFEMLTGGERPFTGDQASITGTTHEKVMWEQVNLKSPSPSHWNLEISPELEAVVFTCLEKDPRSRFSSALELLQALEECLSDERQADVPGNGLALEDTVEGSRISQVQILAEEILALLALAEIGQAEKLLDDLSGLGTEGQEEAARLAVELEKARSKELVEREEPAGELKRSSDDDGDDIVDQEPPSQEESLAALPTTQVEQAGIDQFQPVEQQGISNLLEEQAQEVDQQKRWVPILVLGVVVVLVLITLVISAGFILRGINRTAASTVPTLTKDMAEIALVVTDTPTSMPSATSTRVPDTPVKEPSPTSSPMATGTNTPTPLPTMSADIWGALTNTALYMGPGRKYPKWTVPSGTLVRIIGRSQDGTWFVLETEDGDERWAEVNNVDIDADIQFSIDDLPVFDTPPTPTPLPAAPTAPKNTKPPDDDAPEDKPPPEPTAPPP